MQKTLLLSSWLLVSCHVFREIPALHRVQFTAAAQQEGRLLYLETHDQSKIQLTIKGKDEVAKAADYVLEGWQTPTGAQGELLDAQGTPLQPGHRVQSGQHTFFYQPHSPGDHTLLLMLRDAYGDHRHTLKLPLQAEDHQVVPYEVQLVAKPDKLLTCHTATLTLTLRASDPRAKHLHYTLHQVGTRSGQGNVYGAKSSQTLRSGTPIYIGKQTFTFYPQKDLPAAEATETLRWEVRNEKGDPCHVTTTLLLKRATYQLTGTVRRAQARNGDPLTSGYTLDVVVDVQGNDKALHKDVWPMTRWQAQGGVLATLQQGMQNVRLPYALKHGRNTFTLHLAPTTLTGPPQVLLSVLGLYEEPISVPLDLRAAYEKYMQAEIRALQQQLDKSVKKTEQALQKGPTLPALQQMHKDALELQAESKGHLARLQQNLAAIQQGASVSTPAVAKALEQLRKGVSAAHVQAVADIAQDIAYYKRLSCDVNYVNSYGDTPLHEAVSGNDVEFIKFLF